VLGSPAISIAIVESVLLQKPPREVTDTVALSEYSQLNTAISHVLPKLHKYRDIMFAS
jgi:hypothetical protein